MSATLMPINREQLLAEVEDLLRTAPSSTIVVNDDLVAWLGRAAGAVEAWNATRYPKCRVDVDALTNFGVGGALNRLANLKLLLHQARATLRIEVGVGSIVVSQGHVFDYFDELRKVIEPARTDVMFIDPYLDAEFVSRYLTHVPAGVTIRLLTHPKRLPTLLSAVDAFVAQTGARVSVRASETLHDRYVFVDRSACYLSGASFKDGAKKSPAVLTQISDAFASIAATYERLWNGGRVER